MEQKLQTQVATLDSREVAQMVEKRHADLLRDIETYRKYLVEGQNAKLRSDDFFLESSYKSGTGKTYKNYQITKKGCELIAHKMTGEKGTIFSAAYINRFHEMEAALRRPQQLSIDDTYEYFDKYWRGKPIMSVRDIEYFTTISRYTISYQLRYNKVFVKGADFKLLQDHELQEFKRENPKISRLASSFIVITKSGFVKLMRVFGIKVETPQHFMIEKESSKTKMAVDLTSLYTAKYMFDRICVNLENMKKCIDTLSGPVTRELFQEGKETLEVLFERLDKAIKCVSSMDVTEQLEVLFY